MSARTRSTTSSPVMGGLRRFRLLRRLTKRSKLKLVGTSVEQQTLYQGLFGQSRLWKLISWYVLVRAISTRVFGRQVEVVSTERLAEGQGVLIRLLPGGRGRAT